MEASALATEKLNMAQRRPAGQCPLAPGLKIVISLDLAFRRVTIDAVGIEADDGDLTDMTRGGDQQGHEVDQALPVASVRTPIGIAYRQIGQGLIRDRFRENVEIVSYLRLEHHSGGPVHLWRFRFCCNAC